MGTIVERKSAKGEVRYRAQIRINKQDINHTESRTFSKKSLAQEWIKRREAEIERDPSILSVKAKSGVTLADAFVRYLSEVEGFGRSKRMGMRFLQDWPIGKILLSDLTRQNFSDHTLLRRQGYPAIGAEPVAPSTALQDLQYIKTVLNHAELVWGETVNIHELELAMRGLRHARVIARSKVRDRLPTDAELLQLTAHFAEMWRRGRSAYPMHLILWFAIYSCRRQEEITSLYLGDFDRERMTWLVRDLKNPNGSSGNHKHAAISTQCLEIIDIAISESVQSAMRGDGVVLFPLSNKAVGKYFTDACKLLGIVDLRFHDLRHEGATRLAESGLSIPQIQQYTLHDTWGSLERYASTRIRHGARPQFKELMAVIDQPSNLALPIAAERPSRPRGRPPKQDRAT